MIQALDPKTGKVTVSTALVGDVKGAISTIAIPIVATATKGESTIQLDDPAQISKLKVGDVIVGLGIAPGIGRNISTPTPTSLYPLQCKYVQYCLNSGSRTLSPGAKVQDSQSWIQHPAWIQGPGSWTKNPGPRTLDP